jgi:hypothetical protein
MSGFRQRRYRKKSLRNWQYLPRPRQVDLDRLCRSGTCVAPAHLQRTLAQPAPFHRRKTADRAQQQLGSSSVNISAGCASSHAFTMYHGWSL